MNDFLSALSSVNDAINSFVWVKIGVFLLVLTAVIILGGLQKIAAVAEKIVPFL